MSLKVGVVVSHLQPEFGGHEYYLCKELAQLGHEVVVFTSNRTRPGYASNKYIFDTEEKGEFLIRRFHAPIELSEIPLVRGLGHALRKEKLDIIHSHEFFEFCTLIACNVSKNEKIAFVMTQHGATLPIKMWRRIPYLVNKFTLGTYILKNADRIIALTPHVLEDLTSLGVPKERLAVIPSGVDTDLFRPGISSSLTKYEVNTDKIVLFVGRLVENKGVDILIKAFKKLLRKVKNAKLVIIGRGKAERELRLLARKLEIQKKVHFLGRIPNSKMPKYYSGAHVLVLPTLFKEPFGIVAIEAMSCGVPVIASRVGGLKMILSDRKGGILVSPGNVDELYDNLFDFLSNATFRIKMAKEAREKAAREYDWKVITKKVSRVYEELAK